jgi:enamine deaminase RidA (YjgF/YER057c/UK114 family)
MLNTAGWDYDYAQVVYAVLQDCEHARRSIDDHDFEPDIEKVAREKLARIHAAYAEIGGTPEYWATLEKEVVDVVVPQYADAAQRMNALERTHFDVWRGGDIAARAAFALGGLIVGSIIIALPFVPIFENMFAFALTAACFIYPDLKRYMVERRYSKVLNRLVADSARYQESARIRYMTSADFDKALALPAAEEKTDANR